MEDKGKMKAVKAVAIVKPMVAASMAVRLACCSQTSG